MRTSLSRLSVLVPLSLPLLASAAHAGHEQHVGPGQTWPDIQSAIDNSQRGDVVIVHPGSYPSFVVPNVGPTDIAIVPDSVAYTIQPNASGSEILVQNIPAGDVVTILGAQVLGFDDKNFPAIDVQSVAGAVRLGDIVVDTTDTGDLFNSTIQAIVEVDDTATFWLIDSSIGWAFTTGGSTVNTFTANSIVNDGLSAVQMRNSKGVIQNSRLRGLDGKATGGSCGGDGLRVIDASNVWLLTDKLNRTFHTALRGGDAVFGGHCLHQIRTPVQLVINQSCGFEMPFYVQGQTTTSNHLFDGGVYGANNNNNHFNPPGPGVLPYVTPAHCSPDRQNENSVRARVVAIGGNLVVDLYTMRDRQFLIFVSESTKYLHSLAPFSGRPMLDPSVTPMFSTTGTTTQQVTTTLTFPIPVDLALIGTQLTVQCTDGAIGGSFTDLTSPALAVIRGSGGV